MYVCMCALACAVFGVLLFVTNCGVLNGEGRVCSHSYSTTLTVVTLRMKYELTRPHHTARPTHTHAHNTALAHCPGAALAVALAERNPGVHCALDQGFLNGFEAARNVLNTNINGGSWVPNFTLRPIVNSILVKGIRLCCVVWVLDAVVR